MFHCNAITDFTATLLFRHQSDVSRSIARLSLSVEAAATNNGRTTVLIYRLMKALQLVLQLLQMQ